MYFYAVTTINAHLFSGNEKYNLKIQHFLVDIIVTDKKVLELNFDILKFVMEDQNIRSHQSHDSIRYHHEQHFPLLTHTNPFISR